MYSVRYQGPRFEQYLFLADGSLFRTNSLRKAEAAVSLLASQLISARVVKL
jgi:hypothetical protein